ncbi:hypothetical protein GOBAR_AA13372 [Gossypium barbadense]|uniref:Uncharacterized protein n=1 Tax=Gossypium barbadense TaxID=3634 RepID=A0A2P5XV88_GOSBA|nr:hypothetical protein GOBAR_AA13372 [Gossypium barbadense]
MVSEAPVHPSTKGTDAARGSRISKHQGADAARGSRTFEAPRCRWCPRLSHDQGPRLPMVPEALVANGIRGSRTSKHQVTDGSRGSRTTKGLVCQWCPRLSYIQAPRYRSARASHTSEAPRALVANGVRCSDTTKGPRCRRILFQKGRDQDDSKSGGMGDDSLHHFLYSRMPHRSTAGNLISGGGTNVQTYDGRGQCPRQPLLAQYHLPPKELKKLGQCATRRLFF